MRELTLPIPVTDDQISGEEKLYRVTKLIHELREDFEHVTLLPFERNAHMEQIKVFGRHPENADPIFTSAGIEILTHHSFHSTSPTTSKAALQCLANALLARPITRQYFVDLGYSERAVGRLKKPKKDDEFLMSRILFLTSYGTTQRFDKLIEKHHLADHVNDNIERHAKNKHPTAHDDTALSESLKLLFNISYFCPTHAPYFSASIPSIMRILARRPLQSPPLASPTNLLINALITMPTSTTKPFLDSTLKPCVVRLLEILDAALLIYGYTDMDATIVPLLTLFKRLAKIAPHPVVSIMKAWLLPDPIKSSASEAPGPTTMHTRLLAHLQNPRSSSLYDSIATLFLELAGGDARKLMDNFGISVSAGFVLTRNGQTPAQQPAPKQQQLPARSGSGRSSMTTSSTRSGKSVELAGEMKMRERVDSHSNQSSCRASVKSADVLLQRTSSERGSGRSSTRASPVPPPTTRAMSYQSAPRERHISADIDEVQAVKEMYGGTGTSVAKGKQREEPHLEPRQEQRTSRPRVDTERLMVLFDRLKVMDINDYEDPRMRAAARSMVIELDDDIKR